MMPQTPISLLCRSVAALLLTTALDGCAFPSAETAAATAAPKTPASKTVTSFSPALRCMDTLFVAYGKRNIMLTTTGIYNSTGKTQLGTKEMLINALNQMSRRSGAFHFIDYDTDAVGVTMGMGALDKILADVTIQTRQARHDVPDYYIRGSVSQLDDSVLQSQAGGSVALPFADIGLTRDRIVSLISVDMNVGDTSTRQILPYAGSSNTMAMIKTGTEGEAGGKIGTAGVNLNISLNTSEGLGAAVRALIELGAIETMGQFTQVPYWQCLDIEKTNPKMLETARDWFDDMGQTKQVEFVQRKLSGEGLYNGPIDGSLNAATTEAIGRYQAAHGLIADGRVNFDLYYSMLDDRTSMAAGPPAQPQAPRPPPAPVAKVSLAVSSDRGSNATYQAKEVLNAKATVGGGNAFVYCYYQDALGTLSRIYPNRFAPNPIVPNPKAPGGVISLSAQGQPVKVVFDRPGHEYIACYASARDISLPPSFGTADLTPMGQVFTLDQVSAVFRNANPDVTESRLEMTVN